MIGNTFGSGYLAAIELLSHFGVKLQAPTPVESVRLQHSLLAIGMNLLDQVHSEPPSQKFLIIFQSSSSESSDDPLKDHLAKRGYASAHAVEQLAEQSKSVAYEKSPTEPNGQYMVCNVRSASRAAQQQEEQHSSLQSLITNTLLADPVQFETMKILYIVSISIFSGSDWQVMKVPTLRHITTQLEGFDRVLFSSNWTSSFASKTNCLPAIDRSSSDQFKISASQGFDLKQAPPASMSHLLVHQRAPSPKRRRVQDLLDDSP
jgi:hypothetical protein